MGRKTEAIVINDKDNVATALKTLHAGANIPVEIRGTLQQIMVLSDIPMGHKFALREIPEGDPVVKYGEAIGQSRVRIAGGEHVHVHNVVSRPRESLS